MYHIVIVGSGYGWGWVRVCLDKELFSWKRCCRLIIVDDVLDEYSDVVVRVIFNRSSQSISLLLFHDITTFFVWDSSFLLVILLPLILFVFLIVLYEYEYHTLFGEIKQGVCHKSDINHLNIKLIPSHFLHIIIHNK